MMELNQGMPVLDLRSYRSEDSVSRAGFVSGLGDAYREIGFVGIRGHDVNPELIEAAYEAAWNFVALDDEVKRAYHREDLFGQRGYTPKGKEHAKGASVGDLKEFYHVGQECSEEQQAEFGYPANVWPREVPEFHGAMVALYRGLESLGHEMLSAILLGLSVDRAPLDEALHCGNSILRIAHYFPIKDPDAVPAGAVRAAAHGDINLITLLVGASADGLELLRKDGEWMPVRVDPDTIVVNVGDMLERLTNARLCSTIHRVVNPPREKMGEARLSMPFFMHPRASMDLSVLSACVDAEHPKQFEDITAGEFLDQRLREIGLKK